MLGNVHVFSIMQNKLALPIYSRKISPLKAAKSSHMYRPVPKLRYTSFWLCQNEVKRPVHQRWTGLALFAKAFKNCKAVFELSQFPAFQEIGTKSIKNFRNRIFRLRRKILKKRIGKADSFCKAGFRRTTVVSRN